MAYKCINEIPETKSHVTNGLTATINGIDKRFDEINKELTDTLTPLKVLTEEQSTIITNLTDELKRRGESISILTDSVNTLSDANFKSSNTIQDLTDQLENSSKLYNLLKLKLNISIVGNVVLSFISILLLILYFI